MSFFIRQVKIREFTIEKNFKPVYTLKFPGWITLNANVQFSDGIMKISKKNFWKSEFTIIKNDQPIGKITANWRGHLFIHLLDLSGFVPSNLEEEGYKKYKFKSRGIFKPRYELSQKNDPQPLITLQTTGNWLKPDYQVTLNHTEPIDFPLSLLIGILIFGTVVIRARQSR